MAYYRRGYCRHRHSGRCFGGRVWEQGGELLISGHSGITGGPGLRKHSHCWERLGKFRGHEHSRQPGAQEYGNHNADPAGLKPDRDGVEETGRQF